MKYPEAFLKEMRDLLGEEDFSRYLLSAEKPKFSGLRVNTSKISVEDFLKIAPFSLKPVPWSSDGFYVDEKEKPAKHPYYYAGLFYLQEPSAMLPAEALPVEKDDIVLDICAAPGGKSTKLACKISGSGVLYANDISASRAQALLKNLELFGSKRFVLTAEDPVRMADRYPEYFDKILLDAPCSGEGMFRKEPAVIKSWLEHGHDFYVSLQQSILRSALKMLKPGGLLLYSTCTFSVEEDEKALLYAKKLCPGLRILPFPNRHPDFADGRTTVGDITDASLSNAVRLFPHKIDGEGHFAALLQKPETSISVPGLLDEAFLPSAKGMEIKRDFAIMKSLSEEDKTFLRTLHPFFAHHNGTFCFRDGKLSYLPENISDLKGLHILRAGLYLGESRKGRFEPSQALALALDKTEYTNTWALSLEDDRVLRYLKGETIELKDGEDVRDGYVLILVDSFPLGFGKKNGSVIKNKYLPGWRYL